MNKFTIALALVVAFVGLVAANKLHRHHFDDEEDFELEHGGFRRGGRLHHNDLDDFEGGHFEHGGRFRGKHHPHHHHIHHGKGFRHGKHHRRHRYPLRHGGQGGAVGAIGGFNRRHDSHLGAVGSNTHLGSHLGAEGHRSSLLAGEGHLDADQHSNDHNEDSGIHKHQVLNKDKTIIKDRTTGVNDVDGFHHSSSHNQGSGIHAGASGIAAKNEGGRIQSDKELDNEFGAINAGEHSSESAAGAIGGIGGSIH